MRDLLFNCPDFVEAVAPDRDGEAGAAQAPSLTPNPCAMVASVTHGDMEVRR